MSEQNTRKRLCLPLDELGTLEAVKERVAELHEYVGLFKIGKELFTRFGPAVVQTVHEAGGGVFLDLKFHDIPNTVKGAAKAATELGVAMFNVHASGGVAMMQAAREGAREAAERAGIEMPRVIAVTVLTSINQQTLNNEIGLSGTVEDTVLSFARKAQDAGLDGVVCSPGEISLIRDELGEDFLCVTPGIKAPDAVAGSDQKRVFTPSVAVQSGADVLVVGRAITGRATADERREAAEAVLADMGR